MSKFEPVDAVLRDVIADRNAELESLREENERLRKALVRMIDSYERLQGIAQEYGREEPNGHDILYEAKAALEEK